ncbi:MAG: crosslink repair DNA glycosylase YcaQ family protein, partial [Anaerolineae bacterium]|nr:crosslink repair DNA glycosylase YcaQ family protein [Anaerolineae bacterium]
MPLRLSLSAARALMLAAQGLHERPAAPATKANVVEAIRRIGALQIDTINVVARSPYLVLWSRLGAYETRWLDELLAEGALFEYWSHAACFLPVEDYPLYRHRMRGDGLADWWESLPYLAAHREEAERMLALIRERGPVRSADFARQGGRATGWWDWKPEKRLLEALFDAGLLMVARRERFQRVYDLRERVLPSWDDPPPPPRGKARENGRYSADLRRLCRWDRGRHRLR